MSEDRYDEAKEREYRMNAVVGTEFVLNRRRPTIERVEKVTKTRITIAGFTFNRERGSLVGGSSWNTTTISMPTEKRRAQCKLYLTQAVAKKGYDDFKNYICKLTLQECLQFNKLLSDLTAAVDAREKEYTEKLQNAKP